MGVRPVRMEVWGVRPENKRTVEAPTWQEVAAAIEDLDEDSSCDVLLSVEDEQFMAVAGGNGRYLVFRQEPRGKGLAFANLLNRDQTAGPDVLLVVGGVHGDYPPAHLVDMTTALLAAREYFETGELEATLHWSLEAEGD